MQSTLTGNGVNTLLFCQRTRNAYLLIYISIILAVDRRSLENC